MEHPRVKGMALPLFSTCHCTAMQSSPVSPRAPFATLSTTKVKESGKASAHNNKCFFRFILPKKGRGKTVSSYVTSSVKTSVAASMSRRFQASKYCSGAVDPSWGNTLALVVVVESSLLTAARSAKSKLPVLDAGSTASKTLAMVLSAAMV
jgi:hypothetical protein